MTDDLEKTTITEVPTAEPPAIEPLDDGAPTGPVTAPTQPARGNNYRWLVAGGVVALVAAISVLAVTLLAGRAPNATVMGYVPADAIAYGEFRMDLPGDQRNNVGSFLSRFPGFADQSAIETKIDEVLDRIVGSATDGNQTYGGDIKPWFGGELAFSVGALPDPDSVASDPSGMGDAHALVMASVKDAAAAQAWLDGVIAEADMSVTPEAYGGANLSVFTEDGHQGAYAVVDGKVLLAGDLDSVKAAVDTKGAGSFGSDDKVKAALAATTGDHIGFVYVSLKPLVEWASQVGDTAAGTPDLATGPFAELIPEWAAFSVRVEGDALRMEALAPQTAGAEAVPNRATDVVQRVPDSTIFLSVSPDYGKGLLATLDRYRSEPSMKEVVDAVDQALGIVGGPDAATKWIGDLGVAITRTDDGMEGGLVVIPTDRAAADNFFTSLKTLVSLGGSAMGIEVREEDHAGTTITIVDLGSVGDLAGLVGAPSDMTVGGTPIEDQHLELAYAVTDQVVVIGAGPGFVGRVLDTTAETSLGSSQRYKDLAGRAGQGAGIVFADLTAIRGLVEGAMSNAASSEMAQYEQEIKPFLEPFDGLVGASGTTGDITRSTTIITVK